MPELRPGCEFTGLGRAGLSLHCGARAALPGVQIGAVETLLTGLFGSPRKWAGDGLQVYTL